MKRREFITLLGGAAVWPLAARAQQAGKLPTIGFLDGATPWIESQRLAAFVQRLRELAWVDGRNVAIESRLGGGPPRTRFGNRGRVRPDQGRCHCRGGNLLSPGGQASNIGHVFVGVGEPVDTGLVASLARPGSNVTGLSLQSNDIAGKRVELLRDVIPDLRRVSIPRQSRGL